MGRMTTPMMRQYEEAKAAVGSALLLFRMGDFYELFFDDAKRASELLGLTLTSRDKDSANPTPMAGFPHHQLDGYLRRLIQAGCRAAVCEQVEDPKQAKGIVRREVTRVVSAGTITDDELLDPRQSNWLAAIDGLSSGVDGKQQEQRTIGLAWADLSSGEFYATSIPRSRMEDELARIQPVELLIRENDLPRFPLAGHWTNTPRPAWTFALDGAATQLKKQFGVLTLDGFGFADDDGPAIQAAGALLAYLHETQVGALPHFRGLSAYRPFATVQLDPSTRSSLELTRTVRSQSRDGSLLAVIDQTVTAMGSRLLGQWLISPLRDRLAIECRLDAVEALVGATRVRGQVREMLRSVFDLHRLLSRLATGRTSPRDLRRIGQSLELLPSLAQSIAGLDSFLLSDAAAKLQPAPALCQLLLQSLDEQCPLQTSDGGFIRDGFDTELDELRQLASGSKQWIAQYQAHQIEETGISSLKVGFNRVFGYYLEVTNVHQTKVPANFIRKQTLKNAERYITPELKEYEDKVLSADERAKTRELAIFEHLRQSVSQHLESLLQTAEAVALLDVLAGLAELAARQRYVRPKLLDQPMLDIEEGRHPVLDVTLPAGTFVPNDCALDPAAKTVMLITGPNMAGKSTYIRQTALLTIMAHLGSFVPAKRAEIGMVDRVFARVGASDELSRGQSTFMVEMVEAARILHLATSQSLVILDEIGRGTSTYDGLSIAWAITEHLHSSVGCRTLFATHYHELTQLAESLTKVVNGNVAVREWDDQLVFLHRIVPGGADKSYGIQVARLAGVPASVIERAKEVLGELESDHRDRFDRPTIAPPAPHERKGPMQLTLFGFADHPVIDELRDLDPNRLSPMEALALLGRWQQSVCQPKPLERSKR
jgi:DNA mismatch repair protein MutS